MLTALSQLPDVKNYYANVCMFDFPDPCEKLLYKLADFMAVYLTMIPFGEI
jgi:hypothetical protein